MRPINSSLETFKNIHIPYLYMWLINLHCNLNIFFYKQAIYNIKTTGHAHLPSNQLKLQNSLEILGVPNQPFVSSSFGFLFLFLRSCHVNPLLYKIEHWMSVSLKKLIRSTELGKCVQLQQLTTIHYKSRVEERKAEKQEIARVKKNRGR